MSLSEQREAKKGKNKREKKLQEYENINPKC